MKKCLLIIFISAIILIPHVSYSMGTCEVELTNDRSSDPAVIMSDCWNPEDTDCPCNRDENTCRNEYANSEHAAGDYNYCNGNSLFDILRNDVDYGRVTTANGLPVQMVFFKPPDYVLNGSILGEYSSKTEAEVVNSALFNWDRKSYYIPEDITIDTTGRILYVLGYPFFVPGNCIGYNCDTNAYDIPYYDYSGGGAWGNDWITYWLEWTFPELYDHYLFGCSTTLRINYYGMLRHRKPFIAMGRDWEFKDDRCDRHRKHDSVTMDGDPVDYTGHKKLVEVNGIINIKGNGVLVLKNIHFKLSKESAFKIEGKAVVVFSESIIEQELPPGCDEDGAKCEGRGPLFIFKDIESRDGLKGYTVLDVIPQKTPPVLLYNTAATKSYLKLEGITQLSSLDETYIIGDPDLVGDAYYDPWGVWGEYGFYYLKPFTEDSWEDSVRCVQKRADTADCFVDKNKWNKNCDALYKLYGGDQISFKKTTTNLVGAESTSLKIESFDGREYLCWHNSTKRFTYVTVEQPNVSDMFSREAKAWEEIVWNRDGKFYELNCTGDTIEAFDSDNDNRKDTCRCKDTNYDLREDGLCVVSERALVADQILTDNAGVPTINPCGENLVPNELQTECIPCESNKVEKPENPGICVSYTCEADFIYGDHQCVKCEIEHFIPNPDLTACVECQDYEKEVGGACVDMRDECLASNQVAYNHSCMTCAGRKIATRDGCRACGRDEVKEGNECIPSPTDEEDGAETAFEDKNIEDAEGTENQLFIDEAEVEKTDTEAKLPYGSHATEIAEKSGCSLSQGKSASGIFVYILLLVSLMILKKKYELR